MLHNYFRFFAYKYTLNRYNDNTSTYFYIQILLLILYIIKKNTNHLNIIKFDLSIAFGKGNLSSMKT